VGGYRQPCAAVCAEHTREPPPPLAEVEAYAPVVVVPASPKIAHVSLVRFADRTRAADFVSFDVDVVETDAALVNSAVPELVLSGADPLALHRSCSAEVVSSSRAAADWFSQSPRLRSMLPHATIGLFYRCILFNDFIARLDNGVYCDICTEVGGARGRRGGLATLLQLFLLKDDGVSFDTVGRHALADDIA